MSFLLWEESGEEFVSVVGGEAAEDPVDGVEQLACDRDEGLEFGFVAALQELVEGLHVGIAPHGHQGGHVEGSAQMAVAGAADAGGPVDRGSGDLVGGIEPAVGDPLPYRHLFRQRSQFAQQLQGADLGDARHADQQFEPPPQAVVGLDQRDRFAPQPQDTPLECGQRPLQVLDDAGGVEDDP